MGAANGSVSGLTKIHDGGAPSTRWNLVITSDGYQAAELAQFHLDAQAVVDRLFATAPFDEEAVACAVNVYRLDVVSDESGADKPACADLPDSFVPTAVDTYFDSTFCAGGDVDRGMSGDDTLVQTTVEGELPEWTQILVVVNDSQRGGRGGSIGWTTTGGSDWRDVAIHEIGHSAFALADEYDYDGDDTFTGTEPAARNVTAESDPALVKWAALVTAGPDNPTMPNADCTTVNGEASPVAAGIVGTFEGAGTHKCGMYRPQYRCKMRVTTRPFCAVCLKAIRDDMAAYTVPSTTGDVALETLSVSFDDVPEGLSTVRPVVFRVDTCVPVTFQVTSAPSAPFSVAFDPILVSNPDAGSARLAKVWVRYDCAAAGTSHSDTIEISLAGTATPWSIPLTGNCVTRPTAAVQLVLDQSGSMLDMTSEGRLKKDVLKKAAQVLADVAYEDTGLGANSYDSDAHPLLSIVSAGAVGVGSGREALRTAIRAYEPNPSGMTAIGDGIEFARGALNGSAGYDEHAMIVLTDGKETASKYISEVSDGVIDQQVYAIGLGTADQIEPGALASLAGSTGGYLLMTGLLTTDDSFLLEKYYVQILAGVSNNDIILDPEGALTRTQPRVRIPFDVTEADVEITALVLADVPEAIDISLEAPDGTVFDAFQVASSPLLDRAVSSASTLMRASLPVVLGGAEAHAGRWHMRLRMDEKALVHYLKGLRGSLANRLEQGVSLTSELGRIERLGRGVVRYSAIAQTYSTLRMEVTLQQASREPGAEMHLTAQLTEYGGPFRGSATVSATVTDPGGAVRIVTLSNHGDGRFSTTLAGAVPGIYRLRVISRGTTTRGRPFTREQLRTGVIWIGGDEPSPQRDPKRPDGLTELMCCLYQNGAFRDEIMGRLEKAGVPSSTVRKCMDAWCALPSAAPVRSVPVSGRP